MKQLYDATRKLSVKYGRSERPVKDNYGKTIIGKEGQFNRWAEHFEELLNGPTPPYPLDIQPADSDLPINCEKPSWDEIKKAIMKLKNRNAVGTDNIPAGALKAEINTTVEMLQTCLQGHGRMRSYQLTGRRVISLNIQKRKISVNVPTAEGLLCFLCLEMFSTESSWKE